MFVLVTLHQYPFFFFFQISQLFSILVMDKMRHLRMSSWALGNNDWQVIAFSDILQAKQLID